MKIGDLVKYGPQMTGLQNCFGIVIGLNGTAVEVRWTDVHRLGASLKTRTRGTEISTELPDFLEVVSENR
jgi:hypothetical protein